MFCSAFALPQSWTKSTHIIYIYIFFFFCFLAQTPARSMQGNIYIYISATVPRRHEGRGHSALPSLLPLALGLGGPSLPRVSQGMDCCRDPPLHPSCVHPPGPRDFLAIVFRFFFTPLSRRPKKQKTQTQKCRPRDPKRPPKWRPK